MRPLTEVFQGKRLAERRQGAASILADYAKDQPAALAQLVVEADDKQFASLLPVLESRRESVLPLLNRVVEEEAKPSWEDAPLNPAWLAVGAEARKRIEEADGLLAERFAQVQSLPLDQFRDLAAQMRSSGYRPVRLRPYAMAESVRAAVVWTREGRDGRLLQGATAALVRQQDEELRKHGFHAVDVAGWLIPGTRGEEHYAALWVKADGKEDVRLSVGVPQPRHVLDGWGPLKKDGFIPLTFHALVGADGERRFRLVSAKLSPTPVYGSGYWGEARDYEDKRLDARPGAAPRRDGPHAGTADAAGGRSGGTKGARR